MRRPGLALPALAMAAALLASGCASHRATVPVDTALQQAARAGREAMTFDRPGQAAQQYRRALTLALARNDAEAIGDCGFDLATAQLAQNDAAAALRTVMQTRAALEARLAPDFAELDLVQAAALHHLGRDAEADRLAARAQGSATDPETVARASYVRGLVADGRADQAGLVAALAGFGAPRRPTGGWQGDHDDLAARLALLRGNNREAASLALRAAATRRERLDYRDMAASLALGASAMQRAGLPQRAADLYLQAGQSAAARGDTASARLWLRQVLMQAADSKTNQAARDTLSRMQARDGGNS